MHGSAGLGIWSLIVCLVIWAVVVSVVRALNYGYDHLGLRGWRLALYCPAAAAIVLAGLWLPIILVLIYQWPRRRALIHLGRP